MLSSLIPLPVPLAFVLEISVLILHVGYLSTRRSPWPWAIVPSLWVVLIVMLLVRGELLDHWWQILTTGLVLFLCGGWDPSPDERRAPEDVRSHD